LVVRYFKIPSKEYLLVLMH